MTRDGTDIEFSPMPCFRGGACVFAFISLSLVLLALVVSVGLR